MDYQNGQTLVTLPPDRDDDYDLRTFLHELLHVTLAPELNSWASPLSEDIIERVLEPRLIFFIISRPSRHRWWLSRLKDTHVPKP